MEKIIMYLLIIVFLLSFVGPFYIAKKKKK